LVLAWVAYFTYSYVKMAKRIRDEALVSKHSTVPGLFMAPDAKDIAPDEDEDDFAWIILKQISASDGDGSSQEQQHSNAH